MVLAFHRTLVCFRRKVKITIPQLSPTHTKAKIYKWCIPLGSKEEHGVGQRQPSQQQQKQPQLDVVKVECYDPLFILQCSSDVITEGYRKYDTHEPLFIVEAHDEGVVRLHRDIELGAWYNVGDEIGEIVDDEGEEEDNNSDGDHPHDDGDTNTEQWLWQAYSYEEEGEGVEESK